MDQANLLRNIQAFVFMGLSQIQDHAEKIIRVGVPALIQKPVVALGIHFIHRHEVERPVQGAHGRIFAGEFPHQGQRYHRAKGSGSPTGPGCSVS